MINQFYPSFQFKQGVHLKRFESICEENVSLFIFIFIYECVCVCIHMCVNMCHICAGSRVEQKSAINALQLEFDCCKLPDVGSGTIPGPLEEQLVLLFTIETLYQPHTLFLIYYFKSTLDAVGIRLCACRM